MRIVRSLSGMQSLSSRWGGRSVGFVPTMGALHEGHLSLIRRARRENRIVVVSVFVNPSQFGPREDFSKYPRPFAADTRLARLAGADVLFAPSAAALYPPGFQTWVDVSSLSQPLCGRFRPGHFRGVATVVLKLLNLVRPSRAYFGEKDFQQWRVVRRLASDLNLPVRIVACPIRRADDGVALSSRNVYLSPAQRFQAARMARALRMAAGLIKSRGSVSVALRNVKRVLRSIPDCRIDYVEVADPETLAPVSVVKRKAVILAAVRIGPVRLIDNRLVTVGR
ncbi:MAG TPA: pantoate--beta-alanine ligase [Elusimicrobiota bacterium]|nr:pantoate--beta-alanine ligase [Elusimicrobiota bacterium]